MAVADQLLTQFQPLYGDYRKRADEEVQHLNADLALAAKIRNSALQKQAAQIVSAARQSAISATAEAAEFYKRSFDDLHWVGDRDRAVAQTLPTGCDGGGG